MSEEEKEARALIEFEEPWGILIDVEYKPEYKWRTDLPDGVRKSIEAYWKKYESYLKTHNNTSNKQVWDVYDHIMESLFEDLFKEATKDMNKQLDSYLDAVIRKEF